jgi:hypothetical protein
MSLIKPATAQQNNAPIAPTPSVQTPAVSAPPTVQAPS